MSMDINTITKIAIQLLEQSGITSKDNTLENLLPLFLLFRMARNFAFHDNALTISFFGALIYCTKKFSKFILDNIPDSGLCNVSTCIEDVEKQVHAVVHSKHEVVNETGCTSFVNAKTKV